MRKAAKRLKRNRTQGVPNPSARSLKRPPFVVRRRDVWAWRLANLVLNTVASEEYRMRLHGAWLTGLACPVLHDPNDPKPPISVTRYTTHQGAANG